MKRLVLASIALAASAASWADIGIYGGGSVGKALMDLSCESDPACHLDKNATAWKLYGGYRITPVVGAELTYFKFGKFKGYEDLGATYGYADVEFKARALGVGADFHFDLAPQWTADVHLGYARVKTTTDVSLVGVTVSADGYKNTPYIGLEGGFRVAKGTLIRAGWDFTVAREPFTNADYHLNMFSVGASYEF